MTWQIAAAFTQTKWWSVRSLAFLAGMFAPVALAGAEKQWVEILAPHYRFVSDAPEAKLRKIALDMERFREGFEAFWGRLPGKLVPCTVVVFANNKDFEAAKPVVAGRPRIGDACFFRGYDSCVILLSLSVYDIQEAVHHEAVHYFLGSLLRPAPLWLEEGLAELLATAEIGRDYFRVGRSTRERASYVRFNKINPIESIFSVGRDSPEYHESNKAGPFYAEAWAFLHHMLCGREAGNPAGFVRFLSLTANGEYTEEKFQQAFGLDYRTFDSRLRDYMQNGRYVTQSVPVKFAISERAMVCRALPPAELDLQLGLLMARSQHWEEAEGRLTRAAAALPADSRPREALGMMAAARQDSQTALEHYAQACTMGTRNPIALTLTACQRLEEALGSLRGDQPMPWPLYEEITNAFKASINASPSFPLPYENLALAICHAEKPFSDDAAWLQQALRIAPASRTAQLALAFTLQRIGQREESRALVARLDESEIAPRLRSRLRLLQKVLAE